MKRHLLTGLVESEIARLNESVAEFQREVARDRDAIAHAGKGRAAQIAAGRLHKQLAIDEATVDTYIAMRDALAALLK